MFRNLCCNNTELETPLPTILVGGGTSKDNEGQSGSYAYAVHSREHKCSSGLGGGS